ncbi:histidine kinase [Ruminococcaceae bacterium OttesenSCG-928-I18]|nr:histidine kinase [Ruminococcaceae bacterium OttesenSCG-928-I18]
MGIGTVITISASLCGALAAIMLMVGTLLSGNSKEKIHRWFLIMLIFCLVGSTCEVLTAVLHKTPGHTVLAIIRVADFINYASGDLILSVFALYLNEYLSTKRKISKKPYYLVLVFVVLHILFLIFAQFNPAFISLDEHNAYQQPAYFGVSLIFPCLSLLTLQIGTLRYKKWLKTREWVSLLIYTIIPIFCYLIEFIFADIWVLWFGCSMALFLIYVNIQIELKQRLNEQALKMENQKMAVRISQIQPHFVFNTLTSIKLLIETNPTQAAVVVDSFADHLRANLDTPDIPTMIRFSKELRHVHSYLTVEKQRFKEKLQIEFDIGPRFFLIPPLTLQPIVSNAVLHGLTIGKGGRNLLIRTEETPDCIVISVIDDGTGFDPSVPPKDGKNHVGIDSVRSRLEKLCDGQLLIESKPGEGTKAMIILPKGGGAK